MQSLATFDLIMNFLILVMMPLIILGNLTLKGPAQTYMWREHPHLMSAALVFLGLLVVFAGSEVLGHFGLVSGETVEMAAIVVGIPMLALSVAILYFGSLAALKALRTWRSL